MKHLVIIFLLLPFIGISQTIPAPEYSGRPYYLSNGELKPLERSDATVDTKVKGMGYGGMEIYYTVFSGTSPVRFKKDEMPKLIVKIDGSADPSESIVLSRVFEQKRDRRRFIKGKMRLGGKAKDVSKYDVPLEFKKVGDGLYEIVLPTIEPGEYAFMPITSDNGGSNKIKLTCFGIDE